MNPLITARKKLAALLDEEGKLLEKFVNENRAASEDETTRLTAIEAEKKSISDIISRLEKHAVDKTALETTAAVAAAEGRVIPAVQVTREEGEDENGIYKPFRNLGEQLQAVHRSAQPGRPVDERLINMNKRAAAGMSEQIGADGGFLLQVDYASELFRLSVATGMVAPLCRQLPVSPSATGIMLPVLDETSRVDGSRWGGVQVFWAAEAAAATKSAPKFTWERLTFQKLLGMCVISDELLADATFLGAFISMAFSEEFAYKIDDSIIRGTGAGQPLGILNSGALISINGVGGGANTICGQDAVNLRARLHPRARQNAKWFANTDTEPQLQTLTITKSKSDVPLYRWGTEGANPTADTILGRPVMEIEQASSLGTVGDLILADLQYYALIMRDMKQASSIHVYFDSEQTAFRFSLRINGQPLLKVPMTPAHGSNTLSPFVTLSSTRA